MPVLKFAAIGAGFWSKFQLSAWKELPGAQCVALCDRVSERAESLAHQLSIERVYTDVEAVLRQEQIDFVDIITEVDSHAPLVGLVAASRLPVICQKPMAPSLEIAEKMVKNCSEAGVPFFIHENWRWQAPIRRLKDLLTQGQIGAPVRARFQFLTGFDFLKNQQEQQSCFWTSTQPKLHRGSPIPSGRVRESAWMATESICPPSRSPGLIQGSDSSKTWSSSRCNACGS